MHSTIALSGGSRYSPTTSISFSSNRGSFDSLNVLTRCGFKPARGPDPLHRLRGHPHLLGHRPARPVRLTLGRGIPCQLDDLVDLGLRDRCLPATTLPDLPELGQPLDREPVPPRRHRRRADPDLRRDPIGRHPVRGHHQGPRSLHLPHGRRPRPGQHRQRLPLTIRHDQRSGGRHHPRSLSNN